MADMLRWQYGVELTNVFDTQVADMAIVGSEKSTSGVAAGTNGVVDGVSVNDFRWPKSVKSLSVSCEKYLRITDSSPAVDHQRANSETW